MRDISDYGGLAGHRLDINPKEACVLGRLPLSSLLRYCRLEILPYIENSGFERHLWHHTCEIGV